MKRQHENHSSDEDGQEDCEKNKRICPNDSDNEGEKENCYVCSICNKRFSLRRNLNRHKESHYAKLTCKHCGITFSRLDNLQRHERTCYKFCQKVTENKTVGKKDTKNKCNICDKVFTKRCNLLRHMRTVHKRNLNKCMKRSFECRHCSEEFDEYAALFAHVTENHPLNQSGGRRNEKEKSPITDRLSHSNSSENVNRSLSEPSSSDKETSGKDQEVLEEFNENAPENNIHDETALRNTVQNRFIMPRGMERFDLLTFFANVRSRISSFLHSRIRSEAGIKWNLCVQVEMQRTDSGGDINTTSPFFRSRTYMALTLDGFSEHDLNEALQKMNANMEKYMREGSGWFLSKVLKLEIHTIKFKPISGSSFLPLPKKLRYSRGLLNIENENDDMCFLWSILSSIHEYNDPNVERYRPFSKEVNMHGMRYPVSIKQIDKFEKQNENISVNVFTLDENDIIPLKITPNPHRLHHVNLLLITYGQISHYVLIKDLNSFLQGSKKGNSKLFFCPFCLHGFRKEKTLEKHTPYCSINGAQKVELPEEGDNDILAFEEYEKTQRVPFVIYADFETLNKKVAQTSEALQSNTTTKAKLEVCGFGYKVVSSDSRYTKPTKVYRGNDASKVFIECLLEEEKEILGILSQVEPMIITEDDEKHIQKATHCCLCSDSFSLLDKTYARVVRHHDHLSGKFIGMAHSRCNLRCKQAKHINVIFHNLKNFDAHIICQSIGEFKREKLSVIGQTMENYVSFSLGHLRFIDSLQFLPSSLENLVKDLKGDGLDGFQHLTEEFPNPDDVELLLRKGVYPYDYMDSESKFDEPCLPPREAFYNILSKENISDDNYAHACKVYDHFKVVNMGSYHDLYLKTDVILLCCVFEAFRNMCLDQYDLDPCHFYTSPGLSWASCLKMTGVKLELLTDIDQVLFVESGIRGGISQISNRYKKANNPLLSDYDSEKPVTHIMDFDMTNLYGFAMQQPLPTSDFRFLTGREIEQLNITQIPSEAEKGYILEVSLQYPIELHDKHNDYPLAPERKAVTDDMLSPYAEHLLKKMHGKTESDPLPSRAKVEKLITSLSDKEHYVLHYRNLQLYVELGMKIVKIHRVLQFTQSAWMRPYIDFNTEQRKHAKSAFVKNFYKLMNNSCFGKTMENVRKHQHIELVHKAERLLKLSAKSTYKTTKIFSEDLTAVELHKAKVLMNKPIYSGMCILDLSKMAMYDFYYNKLKKTFGDQMTLLLTDTDSLMINVESFDVYQYMKENIHLFDTSDYPKDHFLYSERNKKKVGTMKDEMCGVPISCFVGLRSKVYSFRCDNNKEEKRAKGVAKVTLKKDLTFENYKDILFLEEQNYVHMTSIRSANHKLVCVDMKKIGLSSFDDKRYLLDACDSLAYGHYSLRNKGDNCSLSNDYKVISIGQQEKVPTLNEKEKFYVDDCLITPILFE